MLAHNIVSFEKKKRAGIRIESFGCRKNVSNSVRGNRCTVKVEDMQGHPPCYLPPSARFSISFQVTHPTTENKKNNILSCHFYNIACISRRECLEWSSFFLIFSANFLVFFFQCFFFFGASCKGLSLQTRRQWDLAAVVDAVKLHRITFSPLRSSQCHVVFCSGGLLTTVKWCRCCNALIGFRIVHFVSIFKENSVLELYRSNDISCISVYSTGTPISYLRYIGYPINDNFTNIIWYNYDWQFF